MDIPIIEERRFKYINEFNYIKLEPDVESLKYATGGAACFDIAAYLRPKTRIFSRIYGMMDSYEVGPSESILINPGDGVLVPTRLRFYLHGVSVRLHPRSGLAWKYGLTLGNCEGIIDEDYQGEIMILLYNNNSVAATINHGCRIAQGEIVPLLQVQPFLTSLAPEATERGGCGFGSTGD